MRTVLQGTAKRLRKVTTADLPLDRDLSFSFLKWCDLSGLNLALYDLTAVDIHDCNCQNVILPTRVDYIVSLRSDWTGASIPNTLPFCGWSLIGEVLKRHTAPPSSREEGMIQFVQGLVANAHLDARDPWQVSRYEFSTGGLSGDDIYAVFERYVFGQYPRLLETLRRYCNAEPVVPTEMGQALEVNDPSGTRLIVPPAQLRPLNTEDRYSAARMLEQYLNSQGTPGWEAMVYFLVPRVWAVAAHPKGCYAPDWQRRAL